MDDFHTAPDPTLGITAGQSITQMLWVNGQSVSRTWYCIAIDPISGRICYSYAGDASGGGAITIPHLHMESCDWHALRTGQIEWPPAIPNVLN